MNNVVRSVVPMAFVASVRRSIDFYERLGFIVENTFTAPGATELNWAALESGGAQLMLARATEPVIAAQQSVMFYVYCDNVDAMKTSLTARGIATGAVKYPFYAPKGEFRVSDPDGYVLMVTHT
jgi:predicted enzyme related to lactoylglutathione lyase